VAATFKGYLAKGRRPKYQVLPSKSSVESTEKLIKKLKDNEGVWQEVPSDMERMATSYFQELFTRDPSLNSDDLIDLTQPKVTSMMNDELCKDFIDDEIGDALFQIGPLKAPRVDGFSACFFREIGELLKKKLLML
jgi:hypothetical protein